jgi:PAS domain S-box-containing protein
MCRGSPEKVGFLKRWPRNGGGPLVNLGFFLGTLERRGRKSDMKRRIHSGKRKEAKPGAAGGNWPQVEETLRRERDKAQKYLDVAGVILLVIDADESISLINRKGCDVLGYKAEEIIGKNWFDTFLPPWSRTAVKEAFAHLMAGRIEPVEYLENPIVTKDGEEKIIAWHNTVLRDGTGRILGTVSSGEDITERRRAEEELRKHREHLEELVQQRTAELTDSEKKYRTLVENLPLVVYRVSRNGELLFVNRFVEEVFGYRPADIMDNPELWRERVYDEDKAKVDKLRELIFREGGEFIAEYRIKHRDGHVVYVADHALPSRDGDGSIATVDGILMDVTARLKLQEKLVQDQGIKTLSEVSSRLAHEIRNPLASAGGFARRLLSSMGPNDPNREKMEIIVKEVGRLEGILRMVLSYLQPLELKLEATDPNRLVRETLLAVDREIREKEVQMDLRFAPRLPEISVDRTQTEWLMETLLRKALQQMPAGGTLSVSTSREGDMFKLALQYPVPELLPDEVEHFFYPFVASAALDEEVGLSKAEVLVHRQGGLIDVKLEESGRLLIQISLPVLPPPLFAESRFN